MADIVLLAIPKPVRGLSYEMADESITFLSNNLQRKGFRVGLPRRKGAVPAIVRNRMVEDGLRLNAKWVLFVDDDIVVPEDMASKLMAHDKDIVAALAVLTSPPFEPVAYKRHAGEHKFITDLPENQLVEVDAVGFGAVLVKMEVFRKMKKPWFANPALGETTMGEDIFFCKHAKEAGFSVYMDTAVQVAHIGDMTFTYQDYLDYAKIKKVNGSSKLILPQKKEIQIVH